MARKATSSDWRVSPLMDQLVDRLSRLKEQEQRAPQQAPQQQPPMSPEQFYGQGNIPELNLLQALKEQHAPQSEALAAESGAMVEQAGKVMSDFYGSPLEYDPQAALSTAAAQHAELMGAHAEMQQMEEARQVSLKEIAQAAGQAYKDYLERDYQERQLQIAREELEYKKSLAKQEQLSKEEQTAMEVEGTIVGMRDSAFKKLDELGYTGTKADTFIALALERAIRYIDANKGLSESTKNELKSKARIWYGTPLETELEEELEGKDKKKTLVGKIGELGRKYYPEWLPTPLEFSQGMLTGHAKGPADVKPLLEAIRRGRD